MHAVAEGLVERFAQLHPREDVGGLVGDPADAMRVVLPGCDDPEILQTAVLHHPDRVSYVYQILMLVEHDQETHPTSSRMPKLPGSCRSPRSHRHPPPPLHTSWPARRTRPGSISFTRRSNPTCAPTCARAKSAQERARVIR